MSFFRKRRVASVDSSLFWRGSAGSGASISERPVVEATKRHSLSGTDRQTTGKEESGERLATGESGERQPTKDRERRVVSVGDNGYTLHSLSGIGRGER